MLIFRFARSLDGLPRTGFATPTHSANYGNRLSEKSEAFYYEFVSQFSLCGLYVLLIHFGSTAIAAVAFVCTASADEKIIAAFRIGTALVFAWIEQQLIQIKINCLHKITALPKAGKFFLRHVHLRSGGIDIIVDDIEQDASGKSVVKAYAWNIFSENYSSKLFLRQQIFVIISKCVQHMLVCNCEKALQLAGVVSICFADIFEQLRVRNTLVRSKVFCCLERRCFDARQQVVNATCAVMQQVGKRIDNACLCPFVSEEWLWTIRRLRTILTQRVKGAGS